MMLKKISVVLAFLAFASPSFAQVAMSRNGGGSGSSGSSTITNGVTATSGCVAGGVLRSISNLVECGAGLTYTGGTLSSTNGVAAASIMVLFDNTTPVLTVADGGNITATGNIFNSGAETGFVLGSSAQNGAYASRSINTPDTARLETGPTSNSVHFNEVGDYTFDFNNGACGTSACTDPAFIIHSAVQDTTQYNHNAVWGQAGGAVKTLTESAATALVRIPVANNSRASGEIVYEIYSTDGTDMQVRSSRIRYAMTNKAGTEACTLTAMDGVAATAETDDDNASDITAGTLTYGIACTNNAANTMDITFNAVSSLTQTTLQATWSVKHMSPGQPLRQ